MCGLFERRRGPQRSNDAPLAGGAGSCEVMIIVDSSLPKAVATKAGECVIYARIRRS
jgi:hypothetical protein